MITHTRLNGRGCLDVQKIIDRALRQDGTKRYPSLGFGLSAHVYDMTSYPGHVIKVAYEDRGYIDYLKYIEKHPNRLSPKVRRAWVDEDKGASVTVMEKLECILKDADNPTAVELRENTKREFSALQRVLTYRERHANAAYRQSLKLHRLEQFALSRYEANQILGMDRVNVMEELIGLAHEHDYSWDLHGMNVMLRPNTGELVVTDPWVPVDI